MTAVWQVSGGPATRSYADEFIRHGVALIGPGDAGPWTPERDDNAFGGNIVRRFASEMAVGDVILLRTGTATIGALGLVADGYQFANAFDDVNGWDLQHARRVRWCRLPEKHVFIESGFGATPPRCSRVWAAEVLDFAMRFLQSPPVQWQSAPLPVLPAEVPFLDSVPESIAGLVAQAADLVPLYQDITAFGDPPSEDERIVHLVVPFLRALGWPPERIAVKWRLIDVAVFRSLPRTPANCAFVIEAKRLGAGVEGALSQARDYVQALGVSCDAVVTDGVRFRLYEAARDFAPLAYANLARLKRPAADLLSRMKCP